MCHVGNEGNHLPVQSCFPKLTRQRLVLGQAGLMDDAYRRLTIPKQSPAFTRSAVQGARTAASTRDQDGKRSRTLGLQRKELRPHRKSGDFAGAVWKPAACFFKA